MPEFYLAGFTTAYTPKGTLHVWDTEHLKHWESSPEKSARRRGFYSVEKKDRKANEAERLLSRIEGKTKSVLSAVVEDRIVPTGTAYADLMIFVAMMAARVPRIREQVAKRINEALRQRVAEIQTSDEKRGWVRFGEYADSLGVQLDDDWKVEFYRIIRKKEYRVLFNRTWHVTEMLRFMGDIIPLLAERKWYIMHVAENEADFICSDCPVSLTTAAPQLGPRELDFTSPFTFASIPLNRNVAIISMQETKLESIAGNESDVAAMNTCTAMHARQLFSSSAEFIWQSKDSPIRPANELFEELKHGRERKEGGG